MTQLGAIETQGRVNNAASAGLIRKNAARLSFQPSDNRKEVFP